MYLFSSKPSNTMHFNKKVTIHRQHSSPFGRGKFHGGKHAHNTVRGVF